MDEICTSGTRTMGVAKERREWGGRRNAIETAVVSFVCFNEDEDEGAYEG